MEALHRKYHDRGVQSFLIYSREAHPGGSHLEPATYEQRRDYARQFRERHGTERPILIDDPAGNPVRVAYGALANMSFIVNKRGLVIYRSTWTRPPEIEEVLESLFAAEEARAQGIGLTIVHSERALYRPPEEALALERVSYGIFEAAGHLEEMYGENLAAVRRRLGVSSP